mgnify:CR=1
MSGAHTPGPWEAVRIYEFIDNPSMRVTAKGGAVFVAQATFDHGARTGGPFLSDVNEMHANARLIAAAPELLQALQDLIEAAESLLGTCGCIRGKTPEHDDLHTHEDWAEKFLNERLQATTAAILKATGGAA